MLKQRKQLHINMLNDRRTFAPHISDYGKFSSSSDPEFSRGIFANCISKFETLENSANSS